VLRVGAGEGLPFPLREFGVITPGIFFEIFDAKFRV